MKNQIPKAIFDSMMVDVERGQNAVSNFMISRWPKGPPGGFGIFGMSLVSMAIKMIATSSHLSPKQTNATITRVLHFVRDEFRQYEATESDKQQLDGAVKPADARHN